MSNKAPYTVQLTADQAEFLLGLSVQLNKQDNRHTDTPIFRIYESVMVEDSFNGEKTRLESEHSQENLCKPCMKILDETGDFASLPAIWEDGCYCEEGDCWYYARERLVPSDSTYSGVGFLTEKAAKEYLEDNSYHFTNGVVYAESAFRNHELKPLIEIIKGIEGYWLQ